MPPSGYRVSRAARALRPCMFALISFLAAIIAVPPAPSLGQSTATVDIPSPDVTDSEKAVAEKVAEGRKAVEASPESADAWGRYGWILAAHQWTAEAIKCFDRAAELNGTDFRWPYLAGLTSIGREQEKALAYLQRAAELKPDSIPARFRYARLLFDSGKKEEGLAEFEKAVAALPDSMHLWLSAGLASADAGQIDKARQYLEHAEKTWPQSQTVQQALAQFYSITKETEKLQAAMANAAQLKPEPPMPDEVGDAVRADSVSSDHRTQQGKFLFAAGKVNEAIAAWEQAIEANPKALEAHALVGMAYGGTGRLELAAQRLQTALELAPGNPDLLFQLGDILRQQGKTSEAVQLLRMSLDARPDTPGALLSLGQCYSDLGETRDAIKLIEKSIQIKPNMPGVWAVLSQAHLKAGDHEQAVKAAEQAIERFPHYTGLYVALAMAHEKIKQYDKAIAAARTAAEKNPQDAVAHNLLAWMLLTSGDVSLRKPAEALTEARRADELLPDSAEILNTLAMAHLQSGQYQEAIDACNKADKFRPNDASDAAILAVSYLHLGKKEQAQPYLEQLRKLTASESAEPIYHELLKEAEGLL